MLLQAHSAYYDPLILIQRSKSALKDSELNQEYY